MVEIHCLNNIYVVLLLNFVSNGFFVSLAYTGRGNDEHSSLRSSIALPIQSFKDCGYFGKKHFAKL